MRTAVCLLLLMMLCLAIIVAVDRLPPQHSPWAPLDLADPAGFATGLKLARLRGDPGQCLGVLDRSALEITPIADRTESGFCGWRDAVAIDRSTIRYSGPVRVSCPMAAALYIWEREVVAPAAARHLGTRVTRIDHLGTYSCRRVNGGVTGRPSQHATANAIDVAAFWLSDGRRVAVLSDWRGDPGERAFLREVRDGGCRLFRGVLSPDYNEAHRDHFHLDMGPYSVCR
jgi:hypothetical protein